MHMKKEEEKKYIYIYIYICIYIKEKKERNNSIRSGNFSMSDSAPQGLTQLQHTLFHSKRWKMTPTRIYFKEGMGVATGGETSQLLDTISNCAHNVLLQGWKYQVKVPFCTFFTSYQIEIKLMSPRRERVVHKHSKQILKTVTVKVFICLLFNFQFQEEPESLKTALPLQQTGDFAPSLPILQLCPIRIFENFQLSTMLLYLARPDDTKAPIWIATHMQTEPRSSKGNFQGLPHKRSLTVHKAQNRITT